jgi:hypothetical protein
MRRVRGLDRRTNVLQLRQRGRTLTMDHRGPELSDGCLVWLVKQGLWTPLDEGPMTERNHAREEPKMTISDQLSRLAARTKELEDRAAAAHEKARADLEHDVEAARDESKANAKAFRESVDADVADVSAWWTDMGRSWDEHIVKMRERIDKKEAEHDLKAAQRDAEDAAAYASYVIDYTFAAVEEAEYAVLDATLARMDADELAAEMQPS